MFGHRMKLFKLLGFEVRIDASWIVIAVLVTWSLAKGAFPSWYPNLTPETYWIMGVVDGAVFRPRRLRRSETLRRWCGRRICAGKTSFTLCSWLREAGVRQPVDSMPGVFRFSVDQLLKEAKAARMLGLPAVLLFGLPVKKDETGSEAASPKGAVQQAVRRLKKKLPELLVITDVCMCGYTSHGHCGVCPAGRWTTTPLWSSWAGGLSHAEAGADMVAPSDMMDGRVGAIREALDERGFEMVPIMSYAVKYASGFYGPFREAAESAPASATAAPTRWTRPTPGRPCGKPPWTWRRAPTSSWSSRPCRTWTSSPSWAASSTCPWRPTR